MNYVAWAIAGWCGTVPISLLIWWLLRRRRPVPPPPPPDPFLEGPRPHPWLEALVGVVGGIAGGFLFDSIDAGETLTRVDLAATSFGAFLGGNLLSRLYYSFAGMGKETVQR